jgi:hypothetical protein
LAHVYRAVERVVRWIVTPRTRSLEFAREVFARSRPNGVDVEFRGAKALGR